uniref:Uncharacterized protein n=1 Tax=Laticauda laticaudata TaxID=8630 RepID=A0A8C5S5G1_LATLA
MAQGCPPATDPSKLAKARVFKVFSLTLVCTTPSELRTLCPRVYTRPSIPLTAFDVYISFNLHLKASSGPLDQPQI